MFRKILVAIDCSKFSKRVFEEALAQAKANAASLMVLHILSPDEEDCPDTSGLLNTYYYAGTDSEAAQHCQKMWEEFSQKGLEMVKAHAAEAIAAGVNAEYSQKPGSPGRTICDVARTWEADLIVIGRWGHSGLSELFLGSVSNYVLHYAPCSVLTVQFQIKTSKQPAQSREAA
ncbi:universal stress protein [Halotia wernerae UHCC 0503]|nr:universal stress protein [Halotia wernerae UHCC 0503]